MESLCGAQRKKENPKAMSDEFAEWSKEVGQEMT